MEISHPVRGGTSENVIECPIRADHESLKETLEAGEIAVPEEVPVPLVLRVKEAVEEVLRLRLLPSRVVEGPVEALLVREAPLVLEHLVEPLIVLLIVPEPTNARADPVTDLVIEKTKTPSQSLLRSFPLFPPSLFLILQSALLFSFLLSLFFLFFLYQHSPPLASASPLFCGKKKRKRKTQQPPSNLMRPFSL